MMHHMPPPGPAPGPSNASPSGAASAVPPNPFLPASEAARLIGAPTAPAQANAQYAQEIARASLQELNEISRRAEGHNFQLDGRGAPNNLAHMQELVSQQQQPEQTPQRPQRSDGNEPFIMPPREMMEAGPSSAVHAGHQGGTHEGLQVYTIGHLLPKGTDMSGMWFDPSQMHFGVDNAQPGFPVGVPPGTPAVAAPPTLTVRRSTFVPGWAVPPRVLLVDDDAVVQRLSKRFLQVYGCTTDVAMDGEDAVTKMNVERYDLVLMDIVMPKLDGVSATHMIRQFDARTPIISMTSASKPVDLIKYFQNGMNDILPKPFSKEGLFEILEVRLLFLLLAHYFPCAYAHSQKHLAHLKAIRQMTTIPRELNPGGPVGDPSTALMPMPALGPDALGKINPLAGMGMTDATYAGMLAGMVSGDAFAADGSLLMAGDKRAHDGDDGREPKRSRFEEVA
jgi:osomolarity two-component system response regulator SKN7